jgi:hypothetical protein
LTYFFPHTNNMSHKDKEEILLDNITDSERGRAYLAAGDDDLGGLCVGGAIDGAVDDADGPHHASYILKYTSMHIEVYIDVNT